VRYLYPLVTVICTVMGIQLMRVGVRIWRNGGRPLSARFRNVRWIDPQTIAAYDRGALPLGMVSLFVAILGGLLLAVSGSPSTHESIAWVVIALLALSGILVSGALFVSIRVFNRPRFLVPPHLRGDPGAWAAGRLERRKRLELIEHHFDELDREVSEPEPPDRKAGLDANGH
jgi:hypothetical protein